MLLLRVGTALSRTAVVDPSDAFRDSIETLGEGDTLYLSPGVYVAGDTLPILHVSPGQGGLTVTSDPLDRAILDGANMVRPVLYLEGPHAAMVTVENLVMTRGNATGSELFSGGGILVSDSYATIRNCLISGNQALIGGGLAAEGSDITMHMCTIMDNTAEATGGGINLFACSLTGAGLVLTGNSCSDDGGGLNSYQSGILLTNCMIAFNWAGDDGGGLAILQGVSHLRFLTVHGNGCYDDGGGMLLHTFDDLSLVSCIVTGNDGKGGVNVKAAAAPEVSYTCCWGNEMSNWMGMDDPEGIDGNISADPLYTDSLLRLSQTGAGQATDSPAVDAGHLQAFGSEVEGLSTRTDSLPDEGTSDMGYHHGYVLEEEDPQPEPPSAFGFSIAPVPVMSSAVITMWSEDPVEVAIELFDLAGRLVSSMGTYSLEGSLDVNWEVPGDMPAGVFLIRVSSEDHAASMTVARLR